MDFRRGFTAEHFTTMVTAPKLRTVREKTDNVTASGKPRAKPGPKVGTKRKRNLHKTSALQCGGAKRENLTLYDWLAVFDYCAKYPDLDQHQVTGYFKTRTEGPLLFSQSTLSRKLKQRDVLESRATLSVYALSTKRARVVTRPDIEAMLFDWIRHMNGKGEVYTGDMLMEKRFRYENLANVPEAQRLAGRGWMAGFKQAHGIHEIRRHGEAGSVNVVDVQEERTRLQELLLPYEKKDQWNADETGFFYMANPDRGLSDRPMSGKKQSKVRITVLVICSAAGEKFQCFFIGS